MKFAFLIPLFPLISFLILLIGRKLNRSSVYISSVLMSFSCIVAVFVLFDRFSNVTYKVESSWLTIGKMEFTIGYEINQLNALMLVIVSLISLLVHLYSGGYMKKNIRISTFYAYLGLFTFAMLGLVMTPNLLQLYVFWELVGLGSFLLIGFYFDKEIAKKAAKKAFIMTRIGDVGLLIGMIILFLQVNSFAYEDIFAAIRTGEIEQGMVTLIAILIFVGAIGKSGQFPLHTWLPDAMEGPTPVSALIHAATMVAAGVYLVAAMYPLFEASEAAQLVVAYIGGFTAIFAASIALVQNDIKRVLAYSTMSQLGFMMLALGSAGYAAAVFHLTTHAFFKALLFLAAGNVIHAACTQNIKEMGGLFKKLKFTGSLFLIGTFAITGVPLFSGFFSKGAILVSVWNNGKFGLFWLTVITAFLTAFYMFRLFFLVFKGIGKNVHKHVKEASLVMIIPMIVLALFSMFVGYIQNPLIDWLTNGGQNNEPVPAWFHPVVTAIPLLGILLAYLIYDKKIISNISSRFPFMHQLLLNKYYIDELYKHTIVFIVKCVSVCCSYMDQFISLLCNVVTIIIKGIGKIGVRMQTGQTQTYGTVAMIGLALLIALFVFTGGDL